MLKSPRTIRSLLNSTAITRYTALAVAGLIASSGSAFAMNDNTLPVGGNVASGSADFQYHADQPKLDINQHSDRVIIDWSQFNIGKDATTQFNQNGANAIAVNRVHDINPSQILGNLRADGKVIVLNSNGVFFGSGANIDVSGLLVSTGELDAQLFQNSGQVQLSNINSNSNAKIENHGQITIKNSGLAAFVAPHIANSGVIEARLGKIALASGADKATVDMYGDGLVELALDDNATKAVINNSGTLKADGGKIALTASAAKDVVDSVINMDGVIEANSVGVKNGVITLGASNADIQVSGKIKAKGGNGKIDVTSDQNIRVADTAEINANADIVGDGGTVNMIADKHMDFRGGVFARGGSQSGNGGFAEISGYEVLGYTGYANLGATNGEIGSLLLDPSFAVIHSGALNQPLGLGYVLSAQALANSMENTNVTVQADNFIDVGTPQGGYNTGIPAIDAILNGILGGGDIDLSSYDYDQLERTGTGYFWGIPYPIYGFVNYTGTTQGSLKLESDTVNFNRDLTLGNGNLDIAADTVNLNALLSDVNGLLAQGDINTTANTVNVLSNAALIQQGIYAGDVGSTVFVDDGTFTENVSLNKGLTLRSLNGRDDTTIQGIAGVGALGTVVITDNVNNATLGLTDHGFKIVGFDNGNPGIENAAVYLQGAHDNTLIQGNEIIADGDLALLTEWTAINSNLTIDGNIFDGKTYTGAAPATGDQFTVPNISRQLIALGTQTSDLVFTNNDVKGDAGLNYVATLHSNGGLIKGNTFTAASDGRASLRVRGNDLIVADNTFTAQKNTQNGLELDSVNTATVRNNSINDGANGLIVKTSNDVTARNNTILSVKKAGVVINAGLNGLYVNNTLTNIGNQGFLINGAHDGLTLRGNDLTNVSWAGIQMDSGRNATIRNNIITNNGDDAMRISGTQTVNIIGNTVTTVRNGHGITINGTRDGTVANNTISDIKKAGIYSTGGTRLIIRNNTIDTVGMNGVQINNAPAVQILRNTIGTNGGTDNIKGDGIYVSNSNGAVITGNYVTETHSTGANNGSGIQVVNSNDVVIGGAGNLGNTILNSGWDGIRIANANNATIDNNVVDTVARVGIYGGNVNNSLFQNNVVNDSYLNGYGAISTDGGSNLSFINNTISDSHHGIRVANVGGVNLYDGNTITDVSEIGIQIENGNEHKLVKNTITGGKIGIALNNVVKALVGGSSTDGNTIKDTLSGWNNAGIRVNRGLDIEISHNKLSNIGGQGIYAENYWASPVTPLTISNNMIRDIEHNGIQIAHWNGVQILENQINGSTHGHGVQLSLTSNSVVRGNTIKNVQSAGVHLNYNNHDTVIDDNNISNARYGVHVATTGGQHNTNTTISNNRIHDVTTGIRADYGSNLTISDNVLRNIFNEGIRTDQINGVTIEDNKLYNVSWSGIQIEGGSQLVVVGNDLNDIRGNGVQVSGTSVAEILRNTIRNIRLSGIVANGVRNSGLIGGNVIADTGTHGIQGNNNASMRVRNNTIRRVGQNGIHLTNSANTILARNTVNGAVKGIYITANATTPSIVLRNNVVRNASELGVHIAGSNDSFVTLRNNRFHSTLDGGLFESGEIDLKGKNIFKFARDGIVFNGTDVSLANNTFGKTVLTDQDNLNNTNSYFIRLANGALFAPDSPTILDATQVTFNDDVFTNFVPDGFILPFLTYTALENRLYDFDDENTLGQIFFTFPGGADINDVLPQQLLGSIGAGTAGSLTILNAPISRNTVPNVNNLANIETAAGGENTSGDPSLLNDLETAAGEGTQAECWNQVYAGMGGTATSVTYSLDTSPASLFSAQASCGAQGI